MEYSGKGAFPEPEKADSGVKGGGGDPRDWASPNFSIADLGLMEAWSGQQLGKSCLPQLARWPLSVHPGFNTGCDKRAHFNLLTRSSALLSSIHQGIESLWNKYFLGVSPVSGPVDPGGGQAAIPSPFLEVNRIVLKNQTEVRFCHLQRVILDKPCSFCEPVSPAAKRGE